MSVKLPDECPECGNEASWELAMGGTARCFDCGAEIVPGPGEVFQQVEDEE